MPPSLQAVLTGDVIASSRLGREARRGLPRLLAEAGAAARRCLGGKVPYPAQVFRGDGWQLLVADPRFGLRAALAFRCAVIAAGPAAGRLDTRVAIAVDEVEFVPKGRVSEGDGPAFRASGAALDGLRDPARMVIVGPKIEIGMAVAVLLTDAVVQGWTARQARAVAGRLEGRTQADIAKRWPGRISQQAVAAHLLRARWPAVEAALELLESNPSRL